MKHMYQHLLHFFLSYNYSQNIFLNIILTLTSTLIPLLSMNVLVWILLLYLRMMAAQNRQEDQLDFLLLPRIQAIKLSYVGDNLQVLIHNPIVLRFAPFLAAICLLHLLVEYYDKRARSSKVINNNFKIYTDNQSMMKEGEYDDVQV